jgi:hypothetical protein
MKRSFYFLLVCVMVACQKPSPELDPSLFGWGSSAQSFQNSIMKAGWNVNQIEGNEISLSYPLPGEAELRKSLSSFVPSDEASPLFTARAYFHHDRLARLRIKRLGKKASLSDFTAKFNSEWNFKTEHNLPEQNLTNHTGQTLHQASAILSGKDTVARYFLTTLQKDPSETMDAEVEYMIFSIKENEGISVQALLDSP